MKRIAQPPAAEPSLLLDERVPREEADEETQELESREEESDSEFDSLDSRQTGILTPPDELPPGDLETEDEDAHAPDDALGLYLRQMGAIPLLSREQEKALAMQLEMRRRRYRLATLSNWRTLACVVDTFEKVQRGDLALDPTIDVVNTLGLTRENILKRMPFHLRTLHHLLGLAAADFKALQRTSSVSGRQRLRRALWRGWRHAS